MNDIKAIETRYKGYRFRSRLEARWAVFFDALGLRWEYEKEGYDLGEEGWYLPDFWLPDVKMWAEVKAGALPRNGRLHGRRNMENGPFHWLRNRLRRHNETMPLGITRNGLVHP